MSWNLYCRVARNVIGRDLRRVDLYDAWDELRNAAMGKAMALDGPHEGTCIGRVASTVEDSTSTMLACLSEDERHGLQL